MWYYIVERPCASWLSMAYVLKKKESVMMAATIGTTTSREWQ